MAVPVQRVNVGTTSRFVAGMGRAALHVAFLCNC